MGRKLLLADDSVTIQKVVALTFASENIEIITASDGQEALDRLAEVAPDVALVDVFMPKHDGYEVCSYIKQTERLHNIPVILLVGAFEPFDPEKARRAGADDYLTKPFQSIKQLVNKVNNLLMPAASEPAEMLAPEFPATELPAPPVYAPVTASYDTPAPTSGLSFLPEPWGTVSPDVMATPPLLAADAGNYTTDPHSLAPPTFSAVGAETIPAMQEYAAARISLDDPSIEVLPVTMEATEYLPASVLPVTESLPAFAGDAALVEEQSPVLPADEPALEIADEPALEIADDLLFSIPPMPDEPALELDLAEELLTTPEVRTETAGVVVLPDAETGWPEPPETAGEATAFVSDTSAVVLTEVAAIPEPTPWTSFDDNAGLLDLEVAAPVSVVSDDLLELATDEPLAPAQASATEPPEEVLATPEAELSVASELELMPPPESDLDLPLWDEPAPVSARAALEEDILEFTPALRMSLPEMEPAPAPETDVSPEPAQELELALDLPGLAAEPATMMAVPEIAEAPVSAPDSAAETDDMLSLAPESIEKEEIIVAAPLLEPEPAAPVIALAESELAVETPVAAPEVLVAPELESHVDQQPESVFAVAEAAPAVSAAQLSPEMIDAIARRVVELMSDHAVREIAWEIVPDMAELHIKRRLQDHLRH